MRLLDLTARSNVAAELLGISLTDAQDNQRDIPGENATYFWESGRGGMALIVGSDGRVLFANSSVTFDAHLKAFVSGQRTAT